VSRTYDLPALQTVEVQPRGDQRWRHGQQGWKRKSAGGFDPSRYRVTPVAERQARAFVTTHHYARSYPAARAAYGLFDGDMLVGVATFGIPASRKVLTGPFPTLQPYVESEELSRLVLLDSPPANAESWFVARCVRDRRAHGVRGIVTFADPVARHIEIDLAGGLTVRRQVAPGHLGLIYRALNATYAGRSTARTLKVLRRTGQVLSDRALQKVRTDEQGHEYVERLLRAHGAPARHAGESGTAWLHRALPAAAVGKLRHPGNHRYLLLDDT
jgi:hypothetical protein